MRDSRHVFHNRYYYFIITTNNALYVNMIDFIPDEYTLLIVAEPLQISQQKWQLDEQSLTEVGLCHITHILRLLLPI